MVESLEIDPFDSDHWLYGTGLTVYGGHDLTKWPYVTVQSLADGIEETSVQALVSIPGGTPLISAVGDDGGFVHKSLDVSPSIAIVNPSYATIKDVDFAGQKVANIVVVGNDGSAGLSQLATSANGGASWSAVTLSSNSSYGGKVAYSADGTTIVWATASTGAYRFLNGVQTTITLATGVVLAADKVNAKYFYAADQNSVYVSSDGGATFTSTALSTGGASSIKVHPTVAGDIWVSGSSGLWHSTDFGKTFSKLSAVTTAYAIALGKGSGTYPNIYGFVTTSGTNALQVSADAGVTWTVISDSQHGFGASSANCLAASMDVVGEVFVGTNGRGIFYGLP
jgi:xyloglucan-specific exo-beta-1,4-glucanase